MEENYQQIAPMVANVLRSAVEQQASAVGLRFEADLSNTILDDVADEPGAMPLLQHGLKELWEHRHGRWLRASEYREIGGIQQAIARTAERIYNSCTQPERGLMENVMLRLIRLDGDVATDTLPRDTRRRALRAELTPLGQDESATRPLVARLANESLVITKQDPATNQDTVEIAHEALIGYWDRLQKWLRADRETLLLRQDINNATRHWLEKRRGRSLLYRGQVLKEARALASQKPALLNEDEHEFLQASQRHERQRLLSGILLPVAAMAVVALMILRIFNLGPFALPIIQLEESLKKPTMSFAWVQDEIYAGMADSSRIAYRHQDREEDDWLFKNFGRSSIRQLIPDTRQQDVLYILLYDDRPISLVNGNEIKQIETPITNVKGLAISPTNLYIGSGTEPGVYTCQTNTCTHDMWKRIDDGRISNVTYMRWDDDNELLLVGTGDQVWLWPVDEQWVVHSTSSHVSSAIMDGSTLFVGGDQGITSIDGQNQCVLKTDIVITTMALFDKPERPFVIAGTATGELFWWYADTALPCTEGNKNMIQEIDFNWDGYITEVGFAPNTPHKLWVSTEIGLYSGDTLEWIKYYEQQ